MMTLLLAALWGVSLLGLGYLLGLTVLAACCSRRETKRAEQKADTLLRSWLTPEQVKCWESQKQIEVIGSHTGTRYRIRRALAMNIDELDSSGKVISQWCFAPQGDLALGDVIVAQKIALETMEAKALASANRRLILAGGVLRL
jgi:hypothetical protein